MAKLMLSSKVLKISQSGMNEGHWEMLLWYLILQNSKGLKEVPSRRERPRLRGHVTDTKTGKFLLSFQLKCLALKSRPRCITWSTKPYSVEQPQQERGFRNLVYSGSRLPSEAVSNIEVKSLVCY